MRKTTKKARAASARHIRAVRHGVGVERAEFAMLLGVTARAVKSWETGARVPGIETMANISTLEHRAK